MEFSHVSVLLNECLDALKINPDGIYVDGTLGGGGHSLEIAKRLTTGRLIAVDRDEDALSAAGKKLSDYNKNNEKIVFVKNNFKNLNQILMELEVPGVDGILLDLGVSSYQLDEPSRGFSYNNDAPLDMRMDADSSFSAYDVINEYSEDKLFKVIRDYGEEKWAKRIAQFIVLNRPVETTLQLVDIIKAAVPKGARRDGPHPAKRTFQAIRIEVNKELEGLDFAIESMAKCLNPGGRFVIITFHSLEDRIVKNVFRNEENPCSCPPEFPICICGKTKRGKVITRKPILPSEEELELNPRARSAKLRVFEKI